MNPTQASRSRRKPTRAAPPKAATERGGRHGFAAWRVRDVMRPAVTIPPSAALAEAERVLEERQFNLLPVVDGGRMLGVLSKLDLIKGFAFSDARPVPPYAEIMQRPVAEYMNTDPFTVDPERPLTRALETMVATRCKSLPVINREGILVGIVAREDVLRALRCAVSGGGHDAARAPRWRRPLRDRGFLAEVAQAMACGAHRAEALTRAVLRELHDRLTWKEADDLAAQLPRGLKRLWAEFDRPETLPKRFHRAALIRHVREHTGLGTDEEAERAIRAVFRALQLLLGSPRGLSGEAGHVFSQLPKDLKTLWIAANEPSCA